MASERLTHLDQGGAAHMVDVSEKPITNRAATAECVVEMSEATLAAVRGGTLEKGEALQTARIAGIMAAKRTHELIPLCHPLPLASVEVDFEFGDGAVAVKATAKVVERTGVEMEALTAAAVAGLTVIDMVKSMEPGVSIRSLRLLEKSGGRSGTWRRARTS